jgi:hypothetical protein
MNLLPRSSDILQAAGAPNEAVLLPSLYGFIAFQNLHFPLNGKEGQRRPSRSKVKGAGFALVKPLTAKGGLQKWFGRKMDL